jgi:hypothetical protein
MTENPDRKSGSEHLGYSHHVSPRKQGTEANEVAHVLHQRKLRFPVKDVDPPSPRLEVNPEIQQAWRRRMAQPVTSRFPEEIDADEEPEASSTQTMPLDWYGPLLQNVCSHTAIVMNDRIQVLRTQFSNGASIFKLNHVWNLLLEVVNLFSCASYHIAVFNSLLSREGVTAAPSIPSQPRNTEGALSTLHLAVGKMQLNGQRLATTLKRFYGPGSHEDEMYVSLTSSGKDIEEMFKRLGTIVPFLEYALGRAGVLVQATVSARSVDTTFKVALAASRWKRKSVQNRSLNDD